LSGLAQLLLNEANLLDRAIDAGLDGQRANPWLFAEVLGIPREHFEGVEDERFGRVLDEAYLPLVSRSWFVRQMEIAEPDEAVDELDAGYAFLATEGRDEGFLAPVSLVLPSWAFPYVGVSRQWTLHLWWQGESVGAVTWANPKVCRLNEVEDGLRWSRSRMPTGLQAGEPSAGPVRTHTVLRVPTVIMAEIVSAGTFWAAVAAIAAIASVIVALVLRARFTLNIKALMSEQRKIIALSIVSKQAKGTVSGVYVVQNPDAMMLDVTIDPTPDSTTKKYSFDGADDALLLIRRANGEAFPDDGGIRVRLVQGNKTRDFKPKPSNRTFEEGHLPASMSR
jgi:hypothetical protein